MILHSHEIRKAHGDFNILLNSVVRARFHEAVNETVTRAPFTIVATAIDKHRHIAKYSTPINPYQIALKFCMERLQLWLREKNDANKLTHIIVERRGKSEDAFLELEFRRIADGQNGIGRMPNLDIRFMDKKHNSCGLQLADLVAHPIGRHIINPAQENRAFSIIEDKLRKGPYGKTNGYGLKVFP